MNDQPKKTMKILVSKLGLDGHDRGAKYLTYSLLENGFNVKYCGLHKTPEDVVLQVQVMNADLLGISILSGTHLPLIKRLFALIRKNGLNNLIVIVGGIIPKEDYNLLKGLGVAAIFGPTVPMTEIIDWIEQRSSLFKSNSSFSE